MILVTHRFHIVVLILQKNKYWIFLNSSGFDQCIGLVPASMIMVQQNLIDRYDTIIECIEHHTHIHGPMFVQRTTSMSSEFHSTTQQPPRILHPKIIFSTAFHIKNQNNKTCSGFQGHKAFLCHESGSFLWGNWQQWSHGFAAISSSIFPDVP